MAKPPSPPPPGARRPYVSRSTIIPLLGNQSGLMGKSHLIPVVATIVAGFALGAAGKFQFIHESPFDAANLPFPRDLYIQVAQICWILGAYMSFLVSYYVYMLCGRVGRWPLMAGVFAVMLVLFNPWWGPLGWAAGFYNGLVLGDPEKASAAARIFGSYFGPGLGEEFVKALPMFVLAAIAVRQKGPLRESVGLTEPLDGIIIGVASGAAFALAETSGGYVTRAMLGALKGLLDSNVPISAAVVIWPGYASFNAIMAVLERGLPGIAGHLAYSGIFGYFIGLAVLRPAAAPRLLATGWLIAAAFHGTWDAVAMSSGRGNLLPDDFGTILLILIAVLSYAFFASAILKARKISPTRDRNFATVVVSAPFGQSGPVLNTPPPFPPPGPAQAVPARVVQPPRAPPAPLRLVMTIGPVKLKLADGLAIQPIQLGSAGAGRGKNAIADIAANPKDAGIIGLRNLSDRVYRATLTSGKIIDLPNGMTVRLAPGMVIDFGGIEGTVAAE